MTFKSTHSWLAMIVCLLTQLTPAHAVQFRLLGWDSQDLNLQFDTNHKANETYVSTDTLSPVYELKGDGPIVLYKRVAHEDGTRKQTACTITIPKGMKSGLLLLIPGDDTKAVDRKVLPDSQGFVSAGAPLIYDYIWMDDSLEARPAGTILFLNLSHLNIAFQIEQQQLTLAPQGKVQVPLIPGAKRMAFRAAANVNNQWRVFTSNPLSTRGPERMIVIMRDRASGKNEAGAGDLPAITMIPLYDWPAPPTPDLVATNR
jgi:hypothetical protein